LITFEEFPKIPRLKRDCVVTEKIDGTNAQVVIARESDRGEACFNPYERIAVRDIDGDLFSIRAGSRNRWITPGADNFGFAAWVNEHADDLIRLGEGRHFGEWYGAGIQRGYGLAERRFALFNTARWNPQNPNKPDCCDVVPVLYVGALGNADEAINLLKANGSSIVPGYMNPEGIVIYHSASRSLFKQLIENDDVPKGVAHG